jgi:dienelactone hydrolase
MTTANHSRGLVLIAVLGVGVWGCSNSSGGGGGSGGATSPPAGSGGADSTGSGGSWDGSGGATTPAASGGVTGSGGAPTSGGAKGSGGGPGTGGANGGTGGSGAGGTSTGTGGSGRGGATTGSSGRGGATTGSGGSGRGGSGSGGSGSGGAGTEVPATDAGAPTDASSTGEGCTIGPFPAADPSVAGPFATVTETNVGPVAGVPWDGGTPPHFTMFRPKDLAEGGLCHPVITWGNGTGCTPSIYKVLLNHLASHGFVVIASDSPNVAQGSPAPMVAGVTWVLEQNDDPTSVLFHHIDTTHIGATGHSQGAMATSQAAADSHITTSAPLCGGMTQRNLHGPVMFFCGGKDTVLPCSGSQNALNAVTTLPAMVAEYVSADHANWITYTGSKPGPVEVAVTAWMRVHLMGDTALRPRFYGASCALCTDSAWQITQKNMDQ